MDIQHGELAVHKPCLGKPLDSLIKELQFWPPGGIVDATNPGNRSISSHFDTRSSKPLSTQMPKLSS